MATTFITKDQSKSFKFTSSQNKLFVLEDVTILKTKANSIAIESSGLNYQNEVYIYGNIISGTGISITGQYGRTGKNTIQIGETGTVQATSGLGIDLGGSFSSLINFGSIYGISGGVRMNSIEGLILNTGLISSSTGTAIKIESTSDNGTPTITNSGTIAGDYRAIQSEAPKFKITNSGTITAKQAIGIAIETEAKSKATIINYGEISGETSLYLGDEADYVENFGRIVGFINFNDGKNTFVNSGEVIASYLQFGNDNDIFNNNGGSLAGNVVMRNGDNVVSNIDGILGGNNINYSTVISFGNGQDRLDNTGGTIMGSVEMGAGEDTFDNTNGTIKSIDYLAGFVDLGAGNDTYYGEGAKVQGAVIGGEGDDRYYIDGESANIVEGPGPSEGNDTVISSSSYTLRENIEVLVLAGSGDSYGIGNDLNNILFANNGANRLAGRDGNDIAFGNSGDDRIHGGRGNDALNGGEGNDVLRGGKGNDTLLGEDGDDLLKAGSGKDTLNGGDGDDRLFSGIGKDIMLGGDDADVFIFTNVNQSKNNASADVIKDFETGLDQIDLSAFSATSDPFQPGLLFVPSGPFTGIGHEFRLKTVGSDTELLVDIDGDKNADMRIIIKGVTLLEEADFIL